MENNSNSPSTPPDPTSLESAVASEVVEEKKPETSELDVVNELRYNEPDSPSNVEYDPADPTKIKLVTFAKLIEKLTSPTKYDTNLLHDVMLTYHSFATSKQLLLALMKRHETAPADADQKVIYLRVFVVLKHWIDNHWHDFSQDNTLRPILEQFLERCIQTDPAKNKVPAEQVRTALQNKLENREKGKINTMKPPRPKLPKNVEDPLTELDEEEIARQLTLYEWNLWSSIQPYECYGLAWTKKDKEKKAPNILSMIAQFNYISSWVATTLCTTEDPRKRLALLKKFLLVAKFLKKMGNLNAVMEILSGINRGPVFRLERTFAGLDAKGKKILDSIKEMCSNERSYKNVRDYLSNINPPCIPYLGMYLTDLTFIEEGNKDFYGNLINFRKRRQTSETIRKVQQYQQTPYNLELVEFIQKKLKNLKVFNENELYECSYYIEPRPGKERPAVKPEGLGGPPRQNSQPQAEELIKIELEPLQGYPFGVADTVHNLQVERETNQVKGATVPKMIERLTHHQHADTKSLPSFLATYRTFSTPHELFDLLVARFKMPQPKDKTPENMEKYNTKMLVPVRLRVVNVLKTWIDKHYYDFENDAELKKKLLGFIEGPLSQNATWSGSMRQQVQKKDEMRNHNPYTNKDYTGAPQSILPAPTVDPIAATLFDIDSEELARQLTLMHHEIFLKLRADELLLLAQKYRKPKNAGSATESLTPRGTSLDAELEVKAPNAAALQALSMHIKSWVEQEVNIAQSVGNMPAAIKKLIDVVVSCDKLNNFQCVKTIIGGLEKTFVTEYMNAWETVPADYRRMFNDYKELVARKSAPKLREKIGAASPVVPSFSLFLEDMADIEDKSPDMLGQTMVNFAKKHMLGLVLTRIQSKQSVAYNLHPVELIQAYLKRPRAVEDKNQSVFGRASSSSSNSDPQIKYFMIDLLCNDTDFKNELTEMVGEALREEVARLKSELSMGKGINDISEPAVFVNNVTINSTPKMMAMNLSMSGSIMNPNSPNSPALGGKQMQKQTSSPTFQNILKNSGAVGTPPGSPMNLRFGVTPKQPPMLAKEGSFTLGSKPLSTLTGGPGKQPPMLAKENSFTLGSAGYYAAAPKQSPFGTAPVTSPPPNTRMTLSGSSTQIMPPGNAGPNATPNGTAGPRMTLPGNSSGSGSPPPSPVVTAHNPQHPQQPLQPLNPQPTSPQQTAPNGIVRPTSPQPTAPQVQQVAPQQQPQVTTPPQVHNPPTVQPTQSVPQAVPPQQVEAQTPPPQPVAPVEIASPQVQPQAQPQAQVPTQPQAQPQAAPQGQPQPAPDVLDPATIRPFKLEDALSVLGQQFPGVPLEQWSHYDEKGTVLGTPSNVQISYVKKGASCYLCDIKPQVAVADVGQLLKVGTLYRSVNPQDRLACVIITPNITPRAEEIAQRYFIKVYKI
jgi:hypothetical protein